MGEIAPTLIFGVKIQTFAWIKNKNIFVPKIHFLATFTILKREPSSHTLSYLQLLS